MQRPLTAVFKQLVLAERRQYPSDKKRPYDPT